MRHLAICVFKDMAKAWRFASIPCLWALFALCGPLSAADSRFEVASIAPMAFEIPPQPLSRALGVFSAATGIEVLVDARKAEGLQSAGVSGVMTPYQAMHSLLAGTALVAQEFAPGTITLVKAPERSEVDAGFGTTGVADLPYFAVIQRAVLRALCRSDATLPGGYRLAFRLEFDPRGAVTRAKRLDTTGDANRDRIIDAMLPGLALGEPPPPELPQPVAVIVTPHASKDPVNCLALASPARRASN
jgi:hypothetical protein